MSKVNSRFIIHHASSGSYYGKQNLTRDKASQIYEYIKMSNAAYANIKKDMDDKEIIEALRDQNFTESEANNFLKRYGYPIPFHDTDTGFDAYFYTDSMTGKKIITARGTQWDYLPDILKDMINNMSIFLGDNGNIDWNQFRQMNPQLSDQQVAQLEIGFRWQEHSLQDFYNLLKASGNIEDGEKIDLVGYSLGGAPIARFTLNNPDLVDTAMTLLSPGEGGIVFQVAELLGLIAPNTHDDQILNIIASDGLNLISGFGQMIGDILKIPGFFHSREDALEYMRLLHGIKNRNTELLALDILGIPVHGFEINRLHAYGLLDKADEKFIYSKLVDALDENISSYVESMSAADFNYSPIILDLDGDGVETIGYKEGAYFDHDGNGFAEQTGWAASDDGLLVLDRNGDGIINSGRELFGDNTLLKNGRKAEHGFAALADLDDNEDGNIDPSDAIWNQLKVWRDLDGDGYSLAGELYPLDELGIKALHTGYSVAVNPDGKGNTEAWIGFYEKTDGSIFKMSDYLFRRDPAYTIAEEWLPVSDDVGALPNLKGHGTVYDLHQAIVKDTSGGLKNLIEDFMALSDAELLRKNRGFEIGCDTARLTQARMDLLEQILVKWSGCEDINPSSRGYWFDGQKLAVMEKFFGRSFVGLYGPNPAQNASSYLRVAYRGLCEMYYSQLMAQTHLKDLYGEIRYIWDEETQTFKGNLSDVAGKIQTLLITDPEVGKLTLGEFIRSIRGMQLEGLMSIDVFRQAFGYEDEQIGFIIDSAGKNLIAGTAGNDIIYNTMDDDAIAGGPGDDRLSSGQGMDVLYGQAGDDQLVGGVGDVVLYGGDGNDYVQGGIGNDFLHGGAGDDFLRGCKGDDTYVYGRGFGNDTIYSMEAAYWGPPNQNGNDTVLFTGDLTADSFDYLSDAAFRDLILRIKDTGETLTFTDWFWGIEHQVEQFKFSDGSGLLAADVGRRGISIRGTEGNDSITTRYGNRVMIDGLGGDDYLAGAELNDVLYGGAGNDRLSAGAGNDILDGGPGNDILYGWDGDDTYIYGKGHGNDLIYDNASAGSGYDTIEFTAGLTADSFVFLSDRNTANLILKITDTGETLTLDKWFYGNNYQLESMKFVDGSVLTPSAIADQGILITGTEINETLFGRNGYRHIIHGLAGNDSINGADRDDQLHGGEGNDTLFGGAGSDALRGEAGNDTLYGGYGADFYLFENGHGQDRIEDYDTTAGNTDTVKLEPGIDKQGVVMFREGLDLLIFTDDDDHIRVSRQFQANYGIERLEVTDGCYITKQDMENIVNAMMDFNSAQGMDITQRYHILRNDPAYHALLAQTWHQQANPQG